MDCHVSSGYFVVFSMLWGEHCGQLVSNEFLQLSAACKATSVCQGKLGCVRATNTSLRRSNESNVVGVTRICQFCACFLQAQYMKTMIFRLFMNSAGLPASRSELKLSLPMRRCSQPTSGSSVGVCCRSQHSFGSGSCIVQVHGNSFLGRISCLEVGGQYRKASMPTTCAGCSRGTSAPDSLEVFGGLVGLD